MTKNIDIHCYAYGNASNDANSAEGPSVIKKALPQADLHWSAPLQVTTQHQQADALPDVVFLCEK